jgi:hypothetical protein
VRELGRYERYIIRYRPLINKKPELLIRTHDATGVDYERIKYLEPNDVFNLEVRATFLIDNEYDKFVQDHSDLTTEVT